jgi:calcineurin-like phosphoesterase
MVKLEGELTGIAIMQVNMLTSSHMAEEIDEVYEQMEEVLGQVKGKVKNIIMEDWSAVVGKEGRSFGNFVLGKQNTKEEE